ncbi:MAG: hypothetical protein ACFCUI_05205 [Bernardetiaceae bacterium]
MRGLLLFWLLPLSLCGQSFPTEKQNRHSEWGATAYLSTHLDSLHYFTARADARSGFALGYLSNISPQWTAGLTGTLQKINTNRWQAQAWLGHSTTFGENIHWLKRTTLTLSPRSQAEGLRPSIGVSTGLLGYLHTPALTFTILGSFGAMTYREDFLSMQRRIKQSQWRAEVWCNAKTYDKLLIGLSLHRQTDYFFALEATSFDADGNLIDFKPDRKLNIRQWTLGLQLWWRIAGGYRLDGFRVGGLAQ